MHVLDLADLWSTCHSACKGGKFSVLYKKNSMYMLTENVYNIPGISIITSEYPQLITVDGGPMCRPSNWQAK